MRQNQRQGQLARAGVALLLLTAASGCWYGASPSSTPVTSRVSGVTVAAPTCPVETIPPQSGCEARPVADAKLRFVDDAGDEVATVTTGNDGRFTLDLAPGTYQLQPQPVEGLMGTAPPVDVTVVIGQPAEVTVSYDTGIR